MKRLVFILLTFFTALNANAQGYSELFAGEEALSLRSTADSISALKGMHLLTLSPTDLH